MDTVIFEQYSFLVPMQLKMDRLTKLTKSISVIFIGCPLKPRLATRVVLELCKFPGEYQRVEFGGFRVNKQACRDIFGPIESACCLRTVEMIGFDDFQASSLPAGLILQSIRLVINRCRLAQRICFCNWNPTLIQFHVVVPPAFFPSDVEVPNSGCFETGRHPDSAITLARLLDEFADISVHELSV
jgi:hypothetical protein